jgi:hypothetical protein
MLLVDEILKLNIVYYVFHEFSRGHPLVAAGPFVSSSRANPDPRRSMHGSIRPSSLRFVATALPEDDP